MYKVFPFTSIDEAQPYVDAKMLRYIDTRISDSFECLENCDILAFDWYNVQSDRTSDSRMLIYMDDKHLLVFCEDKDAEQKAKDIFAALTNEEIQKNEWLLYHFFAMLLKGDMDFLNMLEERITQVENSILSGGQSAYLKDIIAWRQEILRLKRYYEQLNFIFDEMSVNDNRIFSKDGVRRLLILRNRTDRYLNSVKNLQEMVAQLREAYQSQLSIQQNDLMKIFTIVTVIFLPLTLLAGWYGMNFVHMPELHWKYGYPAAILVSVLIIGLLIWYFKKKKWF